MRMKKQTRSGGPLSSTALIIAVGGGLSAFACGAAYWLLIGRGGELSRSTSVWGQFGDYFNGVAGTLVALFTLVAVAVTLHLQSRELAETRELLKAQGDTAERQVFDSFYFRLLERLADSTKEVESGGAYGRDAFRHLNDSISQSARNNSSAIQPPTPTMLRDATADHYENHYRSREPALGVYFRTLYHVFKLIDQSGFPYADKVKYANVARAQLSTDELSIVLYNCLRSEGQKGLLPLVERYGVLKHVNPERLTAKGLKEAAGFCETAFMDERNRMDYFTKFNIDVAVPVIR